MAEKKVTEAVSKLEADGLSVASCQKFLNLYGRWEKRMESVRRFLVMFFFLLPWSNCNADTLKGKVRRFLGQIYSSMEQLQRRHFKRESQEIFWSNLFFHGAIAMQTL